MNFAKILLYKTILSKIRAHYHKTTPVSKNNTVGISMNTSSNLMIFGFEMPAAKVQCKFCAKTRGIPKNSLLSDTHFKILNNANIDKIFGPKTRL